MKRAKENKELQALDNKALFKELQALEKKVIEMRFDASFRKLKNVKAIKDQRKRIARIWTIINARLMEVAKDKNEIK